VRRLANQPLLLGQRWSLAKTALDSQIRPAARETVNPLLSARFHQPLA
jgi:hypothetical protein